MTGLARKYMTSLAAKLVGTPYIWGGSSPSYGLDCSGFAIWCAQVFGELPSGDWRAADLAQLWEQTSTPQPGDLVFYGKGTDRISHVMMMLGRMEDGTALVIGASGGDATCRTREDAERMGARVKIKPLDYRRDYLFSVSLDRPRRAP